MNLRELWGRLRAWYAVRPPREQRLLVAAGVIVAIGLLDLVVIEPIREYRAGVQEDIEAGLARLQHDLKQVGRITELKTRRDDLQRRLEQVKQRLLPGDSATLGAAALQDRSNAVASEKGLNVQSTQVMKEEVADPFRKVSVRLTLSSDPKAFAEFLSAVEYTQQLTVPFLELSRRGAVPGQKGPRTIQVSIEVAGFVESKKVKKEEERGSGEDANEGAPVDAATDGGAEPTSEKADAAPPAGATAPGSAPAAGAAVPVQPSPPADAATPPRTGGA